MEFSEIITPLLCGISPFALGWILLSLVVGIRAGWEAGVRLFLLGLGLLVALSAIGAVLFYLPNWLAVSLMLFGTFLPWISTLRYFIASKFSGKLLMAIPAKDEKWSISIMSGAFLVILGLSRLISHNDFLTPEKSYALGISLISLGVFRAIQRIRYTQIRETGILYEFGSFYKWGNIEGYIWKFGEDKLSLKLRKAIFKKNVDLKILSQFRQEVVGHLSQNVKVEESNSKGYVPVQKAG
jgi:hypothetical protein